MQGPARVPFVRQEHGLSHLNSRLAILGSAAFWGFDYNQAHRRNGGGADTYTDRCHHIFIYFCLNR
jgi:hypothetical protein